VSLRSSTGGWVAKKNPVA